MGMEFSYNDILEHVELNSLVLAAGGNGVIDGLNVSERGAGVDMSVDVAAGSAHISGTTYTESSVVNLAISAADATHARKDIVIYDVATTDPLVVTGTPATPPIPPNITSGDIILAIVNVAANVTEILNTAISDCTVGSARIDELAPPSDNTNLDASTSAHGLLKKLNNLSAQYLNGQGDWATPAGAGDMSKAVYDPNEDGIIAIAQLDTGLASQAWVSSNFNNYSHPYAIQCPANYYTHPYSIQCPANNYSHPSARTCSSGSWAWGSLSGVPTTFAPSAHNQSATTITSGTLPITRGGTGVTTSANVANVNATMVDGCSAGNFTGNVFKIPSVGPWGGIEYIYSGGIIYLNPGTNGYQLTTHGNDAAPVWASASDLIFSDTHCPKCGQEFQDGDDLIMHVIGHNEVGDILTLPMHTSCANEPKKTVTLKRKVMEDRHILDEETGELKVHRVVKTSKKTVTRHKLKEGYVIDGVSRKAHMVDDKGIRGKTAHDFTDAIEEIETTIDEVVYEDVEYEL